MRRACAISGRWLSAALVWSTTRSAKAAAFFVSPARYDACMTPAIAR